jgi:phosphoglucomutase
MVRVKIVSFFYRYDYENCESVPAETMMENLNKKADDGSLKGQTFTSGGKSYKVAITDNFSYTDPIDKSIAKKQVGKTYYDGSQVIVNQVTPILIGIEKGLKILDNI